MNIAPKWVWNFAYHIIPQEMIVIRYKKKTTTPTSAPGEGRSVVVGIPVMYTRDLTSKKENWYPAIVCVGLLYVLSGCAMWAIVCVEWMCHVGYCMC